MQNIINWKKSNKKKSTLNGLEEEKEKRKKIGNDCDVSTSLTKENSKVGAKLIIFSMAC